MSKNQMEEKMDKNQKTDEVKEKVLRHENVAIEKREVKIMHDFQTKIFSNEQLKDSVLKTIDKELSRQILDQDAARMLFQPLAFTLVVGVTLIIAELLFPDPASRNLHVGFMFLGGAAGLTYHFFSMKKINQRFASWKKSYEQKFSREEISRTIDQGNWDCPVLNDLLKTNPGDLRPLTDKEIEELDDQVNQSADPEALAQWKKFLADDGALRVINAQWIHQLIEKSQSSIEKSNQPARRKLLQKYQDNAEVLIVTGDPEIDHDEFQKLSPEHKKDIG